MMPPCGKLGDSTLGRPHVPVLDVVHHYHGLHMPDGVCRIRIYRPAGFPPVVIATELPDNTNTSITNIVDELAPAVLAAYLPDRAGHERPFVWIEHYPLRRINARDATYDLVTFPDYMPRRVLQAGRWRVLFGDPTRRRLSRPQVEALIGEPLPPEEEQASR